MSRRLIAHAIRRTVAAAILVVVAASSALMLARLAPADHLTGFEIDPAVAAAERQRLGLDRPLYIQYAEWAKGVLRFDLGESSKYPGRRVSALIVERLGNSLLLGCAALVVTTVLGIPLGVLTGSRRRGLFTATVTGASLVLLSIPSVVLSLTLLLVAARTGWFPVGGLPAAGGIQETARYLVLPVLALALPVAASLERLQSRAIREALRDPSLVAARARGVPRWRLVWKHAFRLSLTPVLAVYGIVIGTLISGSFVVEYVMSWPGLGTLMFDGLMSRDANLVAGCAATGAALLALGILATDVALAAVDPRVESAR